MAGTRTASTPSRNPVDRGIIAITAAIAAIALAGAAMGIARLQSSGAVGEASAGLTAGPPGGVFGLGEAAPTSFGVVAITHVERIAGLTAKQVNGVTHVQDFVSGRQMTVNLAFTVTSRRTKETATFDATRFSLRLPGGREIVPTRSSVGPLTLQPDASVTGRVSFVAPRTAKALRVTYRETHGTAPVVIALGSGTAVRENDAPATAPSDDKGHGPHGK
jgi:hypothetical protein